MDNIRLILIALLCFIGLQLYQAWRVDYGFPSPPAESGVGADAPPAMNPDDRPLSRDMPPVPAPSSASTVIDSPERIAPASSPSIRVVTDTLDIIIELQGGQISRAALLRYPVEVSDPDDPFVLLDTADGNFFVLQGGLLSSDAAPDHRAPYTSSGAHFELLPDAESLEITLNWRSDNGIAVDKIYRFHRASYAVDVIYRVRNESAEEWTGREYEQLQRRNQKRRGFVYSFAGVALSSPDDRYQKFDFGDLEDEPIDVEISNGWVTMSQHYFIAALVPERDISSRFYSRVIDSDRYLIGVMGPALTVAPRATETVQTRVYIGPKIQESLPAIAEGLELTVDYGIFWVLSKPLFMILDFIHDVLGNWGWAIIVVTILLKILFYPLQDRAFRSMARMRKLQPRMAAIKDRYGDDKQRMQSAMMELYRNEKLNPLGGCLPILVQIPVFIALYWVLLESVEMRQASFIFWLNDLSSPDRFFVLPIMMGITMFIQQKLNPAPLDPVQAKVMQIMPIGLTIFYAFLPSGLVLYWVVQSILSIGQQWLITRRIDAAPA